jgi:hypothetical protein
MVPRALDEDLVRGAAGLGAGDVDEAKALRSSVGQGAVKSQVWDAFEVLDVAGHQLETMVNRGRSDLKVGIFQDLAGTCQSRMNLSIDSCDSRVVGKNRQERQDPIFDIGQMTVPIDRPKGTSIKLAHDDSAGELLGSGNGSQPVEISRRRPLPQDLRNRICVKKIGHSGLSRGRRLLGEGSGEIPRCAQQAPPSPPNLQRDWRGLPQETLFFRRAAPSPEPRSERQLPRRSW